MPVSHETLNVLDTTDLNKGVVSSIASVPVTVERKPFIQDGKNITVNHAGTPRANIAVTFVKLEGTTENGWAAKNQDKTVLQQHCLFFDRDGDGVIWPQDTFIGFYRLGFGIVLSFIATLIINVNFSYPTCRSWLPDPFFRIYTTNIHKAKHGSDSGTYDTEGRFVPQKFEDMFSKYANGKDSINLSDIKKLLKGLATYIMLWPKDGEMMKEDIRGIYDGSLFFTIDARRESRKSQ